MNELKQQLYGIYRWAWLLMLGALLGGAISFYNGSQKPVLFQSEAKVMVNRGATDLPANVIISDAQLAKTYIELVRSQKVIAEVKSRFREPVGDWQISAAPIEPSALFWIVATDLDAQRAADIANATADIYIAYVNSLQAQRSAAPDRPKPVITLIQPAVPAVASIPRQRPRQAVVGALVGLMLASALALVAEYLNDRVRTPEDLKPYLPLPVLGLIPSTKQLVDSSEAPRAPEIEAYRMLRANLSFVVGENKAHTLLITSPAKGEGKSTVARNLAWVEAQAGQRTILFDLDLRQASKIALAGIPTIETESLLLKTGPLKDFTPAWGSLPLIVISVCEPPLDPTAWLSSSELADLLRKLKETSDRIIIDAPCGLVADPLILAAQADATLLVLESGKTRIGAAQLMVEQLGRAGARLVGVVINARRGWPYYSRYNDLLRYYRARKNI